MIMLGVPLGDMLSAIGVLLGDMEVEGDFEKLEVREPSPREGLLL
jgi:hypothetical protein